KEVSSIKTHDRIEVRAYFNIDREFKEDINLGISFESGDGQYIFGYSTEMDSFTPKNNVGYISLFIDVLPLLRGIYMINATIVKKDTGALLDSRPRIKKVTVFSFGNDSVYKGFISLKHLWKQ
ncbi:MAG: hypothetical protein ACD_49C00005G0004, partial [uncultured bacterium (gcode 4)]